ncbi:MAG TPA: type II toxin-antitoxin system VapC family toxin [Rhodopila sp.]|uniref:type II toxin-antitoxin system VapC family toxin n=1 Tax=Rhodopila sp. TaxID=2480087 RepID=UPI002CBDCC5A|nr:type II toxin-antitoxin system VapC family toxin [Rhodopila sp.]HVY14755.1 type II toxin-antitoxin system VapC family toxin [Rhodopila sp.]
MILVDTSVWVDHLRRRDLVLANLLDIGAVLTHPFVVGEVALGSLPRRDFVLRSFDQLPKVEVASQDEVRRFIEDHALFGRGIGHVDVHLIASTLLTPGTELWTRDKRLRGIAVQFELAFAPPASRRN